MGVVFLTVTDGYFFPGTLATVNSVAAFHPEADVVVAVDDRQGLTPAQARLLKTGPNVRLLPAAEVAAGRHVAAWELKAYAASALAEAGYDIIVGIDSDCLLAGPVDDLIADAVRTGGFHGGDDGGRGVEYDRRYAAYGFPVPCRNPKYMSTSLYCCAATDRNRATLRRWADCCDDAEFNGTGRHPGHGDQGVLNAVLFADGRTADVHLLENRLWSQHWTYWDSPVGFEDGRFVNTRPDRQTQRSFHCGGTEKFWAAEHRDRVLSTHPLQTYPYLWFLAMLWFGRCRDWSLDPHEWLPERSRHLIDDLPRLFPQIAQVHPPAREIWDEMSDVLLERMLGGVRRFMTLGHGGSMNDLIRLVAENPEARRYVEIGSYEGGSILTLALRFLNRDVDFYSVESFLGNLDGTMDGWPLPSRRKYDENLARFPTLRVTPVPGESPRAADAFADGSLDFVFVDGCHDAPAVLRDIDAWRRKLRRGGIMAGDDYGFAGVRAAVDERFPDARATPTGVVWWTRIE